MAEAKRWTVTYTKHIHQKRKVYHDGALEIRSNKVVLYDDSEKVMDSRYLKKDEKVECGSMLVFDSHLVDIGEPEGKRESLRYSEIQPHSRHKTSEWNALYTTQLTQKAKKYHDGILRLEECGSYMNQIILLDEERSVLASKHLKSIECLKSGTNVLLPGYLIQICEPQNLQKESCRNNIIEGPANSTNSSPSHKVPGTNGRVTKKPFHDERCQNNITEGLNKITNSSPSHKVPSTRGRATNKPFCDVFQILSKFKRTVPGESNQAIESTAKKIHTSEFTATFHADVPFSNDEVLVHSAQDFKCLKESAEVSHNSSLSFSKSSVSQEVTSVNSTYQEGLNTDDSVALVRHSYGSSCGPSHNVQEDAHVIYPNKLFSLEERECNHNACSGLEKQITYINDNGTGGEQKLITKFMKAEVQNQVDICRKISDESSDIVDERSELSSKVLPGVISSPCKALNATSKVPQEQCNLSNERAKMSVFPT